MRTSIYTYIQYTCTQTYTRIHTYIHTYIHRYRGTYVHTGMYTYIYRTFVWNTKPSKSRSRTTRSLFHLDLDEHSVLLFVVYSVKVQDRICDLMAFTSSFMPGGLYSTYNPISGVSGSFLYAQEVPRCVPYRGYKSFLKGCFACGVQREPQKPIRNCLRFRFMLRLEPASHAPPRTPSPKSSSQRTQDVTSLVALRAKFPEGQTCHCAKYPEGKVSRSSQWTPRFHTALCFARYCMRAGFDTGFTDFTRAGHDATLCHEAVAKVRCDRSTSVPICAGLRHCFDGCQCRSFFLRTVGLRRPPQWNHDCRSLNIRTGNVSAQRASYISIIRRCAGR